MIEPQLPFPRLVGYRPPAEIDLLRERFQTAYPFPHVCIDDFLTEEFADALEADFPRADHPSYVEFCREDGGAVGTNYSNGKPETFPRAFKTLDVLCKSGEFTDLIGRLTGIADLEYDPDYFGGGIRESRAGTFLPVHRDFNHHPRTLHHRRLNLLLYFNRDWDESWGGNLEVHSDPTVHGRDSRVAGYAPRFNRVFLFETSEHSWHGFDRLQPPEPFTRRAWTIYYYTADRPDGDKISLHNTEYVEPPLPAHLRPGHVLTDTDVADLAESLRRRDARIHMLYELRATFDSKYAHLWLEYEYYLEKSRQLEHELGRKG